MDPRDLNFSTNLYNSLSPFANFHCDETSVNLHSCKSPAPTTFSSSIDGRYELNRALQFDIEYIDPAMLESRNPTAMTNFIYDYPLPAIQNNQNELSIFHPERSTAMDFEQQQQILQTQQGGPEVTIPNALHTSADDYTSFDWPEGQRGSLATLDHIANEPIGSPDFGQEGQFGAYGSLFPQKFAPMRCEWPSCKRESFLTKEDFTRHLHHHRDEVRGSFVVPGACQWPGCRSRLSGTQFKTEAGFDQHIKLHMKSHWCEVPGCKHREGFARQYDLTRHLKTHLKEREFKCPDSSCTSNYLGFSRKDKLDAHIKARHPYLMNLIQSLRCDVHGCATKKPFNTIEDLKAHFTTAHEYKRRHRCPVESCTRHSNGFTTSAKLIKHIQAEHDPPKCAFDHCDFRSLGNVMDQHIQQYHQNAWEWECRLPGCEESRSKFGYEQFRVHLSNHHDIESQTHSVALLSAAERGDKSYFSDQTFVTCKYCCELKTPPNQSDV